MYISNNDLHVILSLLKKDLEICGTLIESQTDRLQLYIDKVGKETICQHSSYTKYIWHTHPNIAKAYPSTEDIVKVLKWHDKNYPKISLVFTAWGIWEITAKKKMILDTAWLSYLLQTIKNEFSGLHIITARGHGELSQQGTYFLHTLLDNIAQKINSKYNFGLHISFLSWQDFKQGSSYFLRF